MLLLLITTHQLTQKKGIMLYRYTYNHSESVWCAHRQRKNHSILWGVFMWFSTDVRWIELVDTILCSTHSFNASRERTEYLSVVNIFTLTWNGISFALRINAQNIYGLHSQVCKREIRANKAHVNICIECAEMCCHFQSQPLFVVFHCRVQ